LFIRRGRVALPIVGWETQPLQETAINFNSDNVYLI
jgi:hypothetical protein